MMMKNFREFLMEASATVTKDEKIKVPKELNELIKEAAENNKRVEELAQELKFAMKVKSIYDESVIERLQDMKAKSIKVGTVIAAIEKQKGRAVPSYKTESEALYKKLFELNRKSAIVIMQTLEAKRKAPQEKTVVKYMSEGLLSDAYNKLKAWFKKWKDRFFKAADEYEEAADDLIHSYFQVDGLY
jgi:hypothetical protein